MNHNFPEWVNWIAQDSSGCWFGYEVEPLENNTGWYENEVGRNILLNQDDPNPNWKNTLQKL